MLDYTDLIIIYNAFFYRTVSDINDWTKDFSFRLF